VAYFEWSAPAGSDWDPLDEDSYFTFMPALCPDPPCRCAEPGEGWRHTITSLDAIRAERSSMEATEFKRAYGNVKTGRADVQWQVISKDDWTTGRDPASTMQDPVAFAVVLSTDRQWATICAAGKREDGLFHVEVIDRRQGTGWVIGRLRELVEKWNPCAVIIDKGSPAASLAAEAEEAQIELTPIQTRDVAAACGAFVDGFAGRPAVDPATDQPGRDPRVLKHRDQAELNTAVAGAVTRPLSAARAWDQVAALVDITPVIGCSNALWGFMTNQPKVTEAWVMYR
jgi:hypothetical protein